MASKMAPKKVKFFYKPLLGFHTITDSIPQVKKHRKSNLNPIATLKCSLLSFSRFRTLGSSHSWSCPPCFFWRFYTYQHCDFLQLVYLHCSIWPPSANAALAPHPRLQTAYPFSADFVSSPCVPSPPPHAPGCSLCLLLSLPFPNSLRVLQWNAGGLRARSTKLLHFNSSYLVDLIYIQESNLNLSSSFQIPGFSALRSHGTHS